MSQQQSVYVADRRIYLDHNGRPCGHDAPTRRELLVAEGGRLPIERAIELGLVERAEVAPGLSEHDRVSVDHPLYAQVFTDSAPPTVASGVPAAEHDARDHAGDSAAHHGARKHEYPEQTHADRENADHEKAEAWNEASEQNAGEQISFERDDAAQQPADRSSPAGGKRSWQGSPTFSPLRNISA